MTDPNELACVDRVLREWIARLELVSHGPTQSFDTTARDTTDAPGGRRPGRSDREPRPRDVEEHEDWEASYHRKTPDFFKRERRNVWQRFDRDQNETVAVAALGSLGAEAKRCHEAWRISPPKPKNPNPEYERKSYEWKCKIADDDSGTEKDRCARYDIKPASLYRYRAKYRGLMRWAA